MGVNLPPLPNGIKLVNTGLAPNDFLGDPLPVAFEKINDNFRLVLTRNDPQLPGNVNFTGPVTFPQQVTLQGNTVVESNGSLTVNGTTFLNGTTQVNGSITFRSQATFDGPTSFNRATRIAGPLDVTGNATFHGLTRFNGPVEFAGPVSLPALELSLGRDDLNAANPGPRKVLALDGNGVNLHWTLLQAQHLATVNAPKAGQVLTYTGNSLDWRDPMPVLSYVIEGTTHNNVPTELFREGSTAGNPLRMTLPEDTTWAFHIVLAGRTVGSNNESAGFEFKGVIDNNGGIVDMVGQPIKVLLAQDTQEWDASVTADNVHGALVVQVVGERDKIVSWRGAVTIAPVS
jgi:hypothetical protein